MTEMEKIKAISEATQHALADMEKAKEAAYGKFGGIPIVGQGLALVSWAAKAALIHARLSARLELLKREPVSL